MTCLRARLARSVPVVAMVGLSSATLTGCPDWLDFSYAVSTSELTNELGPKSVRYQHVERLLDDKTFDKAYPDYRHAEYDVARALRRRDLIDTPRVDVELALRLATVRRDVARRYVRRFRRARDLLDRCDVEPYTEEDYEISDGRKFVKRWNRLVDAEHGIITAGSVSNRMNLEAQRWLVVALRIGLREYEQGGGPAFVRAAGRWHDYQRRADDSPWDDRYDKAADRWEKARQGLIKAFDQSSDISDLVTGIEYDYRRSFFEEDGAFVYSDAEPDSYDYDAPY